MKLLILNGPNLNLLGQREPDIYGHSTYADLCGMIADYAKERGHQARFVQSNHEGALIDAIQLADADGTGGIVINPGAYAHYSYAIHDALRSIRVPAVEVHISDVSKREDFRQVSYARLACLKTYMGLGLDGYRQGILYLKEYLSSHR